MERGREGRIERPVPRVRARGMARSRTRSVASPNRTHVAAGVLDAGEPSRADAGQHRRALRRALRRRGRRHRHLEHVGEDLPPEGARDAAAGRADLVGGGTPTDPHQLERVPQPERHAFEHRPREVGRPWWTVRPTNAPRASGSGCGRALAREVREEQEPVAARRRPRAASSTRSANPTPGASASRYQRRLPAADSITPITCHATGTAWQNACEPALGLDRRPVGRGEDDAGGAERERDDARASTAPTPTAAAAWSPPPATTGVPGAEAGRRRPPPAVTAPVTSGPSYVARQPRGIDLERRRRPRPTSRAGARSNSSVPEPSARSTAWSPVSRSRT